MDLESSSIEKRDGSALVGQGDAHNFRHRCSSGNAQTRRECSDLVILISNAPSRQVNRGSRAVLQRHRLRLASRLAVRTLGVHNRGDNEDGSIGEINAALVLLFALGEEKVGPSLVIFSRQGVAGILGAVFCVDGLGCESDEDGGPMVLELDKNATVLIDAIVLGVFLGVALVLVVVVDTLAVVEMGAEDVDGGLGGDGLVKNRLQLVEDIIILTWDVVREDAALFALEEVAADIVKGKAIGSLIASAGEEMEADIEWGEFLGDGVLEISQDPGGEAGFIGVARLDVNSGTALAALVVGEDKREMRGLGIIFVCLVGVLDR